LQSPKSGSVSTYLELKSDPETGANAIEIVKPDLTAADATAQRLATLPEVALARTLTNFVPQDQDEKLRLIRNAATAIDASRNPSAAEARPTDQETIDDLSATAASLAKVAGQDAGAGPEAARRLSGLLSRLAKAEPSARQQVEAAIVEPLRFSLDQLRAA